MLFEIILTESFIERPLGHFSVADYLILHSKKINQSVKDVFNGLTHVKVTYLLLIGPDRHVIIHNRCHGIFFSLSISQAHTFAPDLGHYPIPQMTFQQLSFSVFNFTSTKACRRDLRNTLDIWYMYD